MELTPEDDGKTCRLWYWSYIDDQQGMYVRLNLSCSMEKYSPETKRWSPMDGYYLKRATQDPDFIEISLSS